MHSNYPITKPKVHIITREVTLASGELVRAFFAVIDINGVLDVKFLGTKPLETQEEASAKPLLIECASKICSNFRPIVSPFEKVSHYFTLDFLVNQLARAPSRN